MTRDHLSATEQSAMHTLDLLRAGASIPPNDVDDALRITGDLLGLREFTDDGEPILILERRAA